jgi:UDP-glucose 4-epimerase
VVLHLAHYGFSIDTEGLPPNDLKILDHSVKLFESCSDHRVKKVIFLSSGGKIYGRTDKLPLRETDIANPLGSYGITKLAIEKHLQSLSYFRDFNAVILRPSNPYGVRQSPIGAQGAVPIFAWRILHEQPITIFGSGSAVRDYLHVTDVANACATAVLKPCRGIYNIGSGIGVSTIELVQVLSEIIGVSAIIKNSPERLSDLPAIVLDSTKAKLDFGWETSIALRDGLVDVISWLRQLKE